MSEVEIATSNETTTLLRLLQDEVQRLRSTERNQIEEIEKNERDTKRTTVMLQLTHDQLQLLKDANVKLQTQLLDGAAERGKMLQDLKLKEEALEHAVKTTTMNASLHSDKVNKLTAEIEIAKNRIASQESANKTLRDEIAVLKERIETLNGEREREARSAFEYKTALEVRLQHKTVELGDLEAMRAKETKEVTAREYELSKLIAELKRQKHELEESLDREKRSNFQLVTSLKAEGADAGHRLLAVKSSTDGIIRDQIEQIERYKAEIAQLNERLEEANSSHKARIKVLELQNAKFCADLKSAQSEVNALAERDVAASKERAEAIITLNARNDVSRLRIEELEAEVALLKESMRATILAHSAAVDESRMSFSTALKQQQDATNAKAQALQHTSMDLRVAESRLRAVEEEMQQVADRNSKLSTSQANEISALRAEIEGYRNAVKKLEDHIENNYEVRVLREQNEALTNDVAEMKERLHHANHTLANLRIEADISESYRYKMLQEHLETQLGRVGSLEKERRSARQLLGALVTLAKKKDSLDASLTMEVDQFFRVFGAS